jgi:hypothetical protein
MGGPRVREAWPGPARPIHRFPRPTPETGTTPPLRPDLLGGQFGEHFT